MGAKISIFGRKRCLSPWRWPPPDPPVLTSVPEPTVSHMSTGFTHGRLIFACAEIPRHSPVGDLPAFGHIRVPIDTMGPIQSIATAAWTSQPVCGRSVQDARQGRRHRPEGEGGIHPSLPFGTSACRTLAPARRAPSASPTDPVGHLPIHRGYDKPQRTLVPSGCLRHLTIHRKCRYYWS